MSYSESSFGRSKRNAAFPPASTPSFAANHLSYSSQGYKLLDCGKAWRLPTCYTCTRSHSSCHSRRFQRSIRLSSPSSPSTRTLYLPS